MEFEKALLKLASFCAYRERCSSEVRNKMAELQLSEQLQERLINYLQEENYLNDERFAAAYARSKFRQKQWGRGKIRLMLKQKRLPEPAIRAAINSIDPDEYWQVLLALAEKKLVKLMQKPGKTVWQHALFHYLTGKGFESDLVTEALCEVGKTIRD
ncbi:regulatory protein RecX [Rhodoflexus sp.]